jgi:hypothetical protein
MRSLFFRILAAFDSERLTGNDFIFTGGWFC